MKSHSFEDQLKSDIEAVFTVMLNSLEYTLPESSCSKNTTKLRDRLKECFTKYIADVPHPRIYGCSCSAPGIGLYLSSSGTDIMRNANC